MKIADFQIVKYLLYFKSLIWLLLAVFYFTTQANPNPNVAFHTVAALLFLNACTYFLLGLFWNRKKWSILYFAYFFILANIILTITDQVGIIDIVSFITDCIILVLVFQGRKEFAKTK